MKSGLPADFSVWMRCSLFSHGRCASCWCSWDCFSAAPEVSSHCSALGRDAHDLDQLGIRRGGHACGCLATPATAPAERKDSYADKIEQEKKTLEKLRGTIVEKRKKADEAEKKRESVLQGLQSLDERLVRYRQEHQDIRKQLKKKDLEIEHMSVQLSRLSERIDERQDAIAARLRVQYVEGRFWHLKTLLAASSSGDFQRRFRYLSAVTQREYDIMERYRKDADRIAEVERNREEARQGILAYKTSTEEKLTQIQRLKKEKRVYLAKITQEKESHDRAVEELERSASRVDSLLQELETRRRAAMASRPPSMAGGLKALRGTLLWPTDGQVVSYFGRQKHPTFNTYIQRKGIEIRAAEGSRYTVGACRSGGLCGLVERLWTRYNCGSCQRSLFPLRPRVENSDIRRDQN